MNLEVHAIRVCVCVHECGGVSECVCVWNRWKLFKITLHCSPTHSFNHLSCVIHLRTEHLLYTHTRTRTHTHTPIRDGGGVNVLSPTKGIGLGLWVRVRELVEVVDLSHTVCVQETMNFKH